jgi:hypothetical protein
MMKSRGAAVIGAFLLIALAIFLRGLIVGDDGASGSDGPSTPSNGGDLPVVACTPELMAVCDALADDGRIADDPPELDLPKAAQPPPDVDGWITWSPAPQIANYIHSTTLTPRIWSTTEALGSAPEIILADGDTATRLASDCKATSTWACLGGLAPELSIGVGDPRTAEGIARLAPFAQAFSTDGDFETLDTDALDAIVRSPAEAQSDAAQMAQRLTTRVGSLSMVAGPEALLDRQTTTPAGKDRKLKVIASSPASSLTAVLAARAGREDELAGLSCKDLPKTAKAAVTSAGLAPCTGSVDDALAGFLYQVQKRVG